MADDDIWILGIEMTKFGKHPDKDTIDLGAEAALGALADGGVTMHDVQRARRRQPHGRRRRHRPAAAEADRPDRHPRLQRRQRLRYRGHRPAHGDHGRQGGRGRVRPGRRRREAGRRRPPRPRRPRKKRQDTWEPSGRFGAVAALDGRIGTEIMPGVFAQVGMQYLHQHEYGGDAARAVRADHARRTTPTPPSTRWPPTRRP